MDGISKAEEQNQKPGFVGESNGEELNLENKSLPAGPNWY